MSPCAIAFVPSTTNGFARLPEPMPGVYFSWQSELCEGCGKCLEVCPCGFLCAGDRQ